MSETAFQAHSAKQERVLFSPSPIILLACGIQFGKTMAGAVRMKMEMHSHVDPSDNFLIVAPTYKILQQSTLPPFLRIMEGYGDYSKSDSVFKMHGGGTCYMRTGTDPDSIVGITNIRFVWGDEAGLYSLYFWQNLQARAAFKKASILLTTSPYSLNWVFKELIRPKMKDRSARPDCEMIQARSDENPYFPREIYERNRATMDPRRFNMMFGGTWERMEGLVYDCFDDVENICDPIPFPDGTRFVAGVDWGWSNPYAIAVRAITPSGQHFQVSEFYKTQLTLDQKIQVARQLKAVWNIEVFYCDPASPDDIESFNRAGLRAVGANNAIRLGIDRHYELIKTRRYKIFRNVNPHTEDEYASYHYPSPADIDADKDMKDPEPVKQMEHLMDANRYVTTMTYLGAKRHQARVPDEVPQQESHAQRIERLKRPMRVGGGSEDW